jgi:hypothetical protein
MYNAVKKNLQCTYTHPTKKKKTEIELIYDMLHKFIKKLKLIRLKLLNDSVDWLTWKIIKLAIV